MDTVIIYSLYLLYIFISIENENENQSLDHHDLDLIPRLYHTYLSCVLPLIVPAHVVVYLVFLKLL